MKGKGKREGWAGIVDGGIHFYRLDAYYDNVRHADLFGSKREAEKCYEEVVRVTVERQPKKTRKP